MVMKVNKKTRLTCHRIEHVTTCLSGQMRTNIFEEAIRQADAVRNGLSMWQTRQLSSIAYGKPSLQKSVRSRKRRQPKATQLKCSKQVGRRRNREQAQQSPLSQLPSFSEHSDSGVTFRLSEDMNSNNAPTSANDKLTKASSPVSLSGNHDVDLPAGLTEVGSSGFEPGDLIWVRYMSYPMWPAVVLKRWIRKKRPYISYVFIEYTEDGKFKTYRQQSHFYRKQYYFSIYKDFAKLKAAGLSSIHGKDFARAIDRVEAYLTVTLSVTGQQQPGSFLQERDKDSIDAVLKFFTNDLTVNIPDVNDAIASACSVDERNSLPEARMKHDIGACLPHKNERESELDLEETSARRVKSLMSFIESSKCKKHLLNVYSQKKQSSFQLEFVTKRKTPWGQFQLNSRGFGPMMPYYSEIERAVSTIEKYIESTQGGKSISSDQHLIILYILLPEAIVMALQHVDKLSRRDAETVFYNGNANLQSQVR